MKKNIILLLILIALINIPSLLYAGKPVAIDRTLTIKNISQALEYIEDTDEKLKLDDITGDLKKWKKVNSEYINFGYTYSDFWFRFTILNNTATMNFLLEIDFPPIDNIKLYIPDNSGGYTIKRGGDAIPFEERDIADKSYIFRLKQKPGKSSGSGASRPLSPLRTVRESFPSYGSSCLKSTSWLTVAISFSVHFP